MSPQAIAEALAEERGAHEYDIPKTQQGLAWTRGIVSHECSNSGRTEAAVDMYIVYDNCT